MLVEFILQNAILSVLALVLGGATVFLWLTGGDKSLLDPEGAVAAMNYDHAQVFDLRPRKEYDAGHIPGARHLESTTAVKKVPTLAKKKPALLVCAKGTTSNETARKLRDAGLDNTFVLKGGMNAWQQDGKPLSRK